MASDKRHIGNGQSVPQVRPKPRTVLEHAKRIADDLEGMREQDQWIGSLQARFRGAGQSDVIRMWEAGTNERGLPLSKFELQALAERWCELFGFLPPCDDAALAAAREPEPADTTMLDMHEVERMTGLSESTIERRIKEGKFPKPVKTSTRRNGWRAGAVKEWIDQRDPNRR